MSATQKYLIEPAARLCTALRFLTIIPVSWNCTEDHHHFTKCMIYFPIIGLVIGLLGYCLALLSLPLFPQEVVAALFVIFFGLISGFLHLDGLADSADGLLSARPKEQSLEIMKDSRVGAMGVIAIAALFLMKYSALATVSPGIFALSIFIIPLSGRCAILFCMAVLRYAREEGGIGSLFYSSDSKRNGVLSCIGFVILMIIIAPYYGIFVICVFFGVNYLFCKFCETRIGGATGDTLGAACEITEAAVAIALTISI